MSFRGQILNTVIFIELFALCDIIKPIYITTMKATKEI